MFKFLVLISLISAFFSVAAAQVNPQTPGINQKNEAAKIETYTDLFDFRVIKDSFTENGFVLERRFQTLPGSPDKPEYAVLLRNNKTVFRFDCLKHPFTSVFLGMFPFLGTNERQLFVAQIAPRSGSHWILNLKTMETLFDSDEYNVGREDFHILDLDGDRVFELSFESLAFYNFEPQRLESAGVPLTEIIFRYDSQRRKYVPANPQFGDYVLRGVDEQTARIRRGNKDFQLSGVLVVALQYVYAGRESEGWDFFDRNYNFADGIEIKTKARAILQNDAVYQYIYKQNQLQ